MSGQQTRIEWTGNIQVHHPVKEPSTIGDWLTLQESINIMTPQEWRSRFWDRVLPNIEAENPRRDAA
jgi:hypothetical protein